MAKAGGIPGSLSDASSVKTAIAAAFGVAPGDVTVSNANIKFFIEGAKALGALPFDLGIPALNLKAVGNIDATLNYKVLVNVNVTDNTFEYLTTGADEIHFDITVDVAKLNANGNIGPLKVNITKYAGAGSTNAAFGIDVDIVSATSNQFKLAPKVNGTVNADLGINANFLGFDDKGVPNPGLNPTLQTQFHFAWDFGLNTSYSTTDKSFVTYGSLTASFPKIELNLGTTIQGMMEPVSEYLDKFAGSFMKIIEPFKKEIPLVNKSILFMLNKILDSSNDEQYVKASKFLKQLDDLVGLYEAAKKASASGVVYLGKLDLKKQTGFDIQIPTSNISQLQIVNGDNAQSSEGSFGDAEKQSDFFGMLDKIGIKLPIFPSKDNPLEPFKMLLGQPAKLVTFSTDFKLSSSEKPLFEFNFLIGPFPAQVQGTLKIEFSGGLVFGLDTTGIISNPSHPENGFYIQTPPSSPLFKLVTTANIYAVLGNRSIVSAGVKGGIVSDLSATLDSGNPIYFDGLSNKLKSGCVIDLNGSIYFKIEGYASIICGVSVSWDGVEPKYCEKTYPASRFDIYNWSLGCNPNVKGNELPPQPVLAEVINGTLNLNMGPRAALRGQFTNEINEEFAVSPLDPANPGNGSVVATAFGFTQNYTGVERINADSGNGDDVIQILDTPYLTTILGGSGNDNLKVTVGEAYIDAGDGNDSIFGGLGNDAIFAGLGNDYILLGWGQDTVYGGGGDDYITTDVKVPVDPKNKNNKYIDGGDGNDQIYGGTGDDTIFGQLGMDTIGGGLGNDIIVGGDDHDTFIYMFDYGSQEIDGGSGQNEFQFIGGNDTDNISIGSNTGQLVLNKSTNGAAITTMTSITEMSINLGDGGDNLGLYDLSGTMLNNTAIFLGLSPKQVNNVPPPKTMSPDSFADEVFIAGTNNDDNINIVPIASRSSSLDGTLQVTRSWMLSTISSPNQLDKLTLNGLAGDDQLSALSSAILNPAIMPEALMRIAIDGSTGNDLIRGAQTAMGGSGDDTIFGTDGNDVLLGGLGNDSIEGLQGEDLILGDGTATGIGAFVIDPYTPTGGNDTILGGDGADSINGGAGNDSIEGGDGADTIGVMIAALNPLLPGDFLEPGNDLIAGGLGDDSVQAGDGNDVVFGNEGQDRISGQAGNDTIDGGIGNDTIFGNEDNDTILGGDGKDTIDGGAGDDYIAGNNDEDSILGAAGADTIDGSDGADILFGNAGNDSILGGLGNDTIDGGTGDDSIAGNAGDDSILGGAGNDTVDGGDGADIIFGNDGSDSILGGLGNDSIDGGTGDDAIAGNAGNDSILGGDGNDSIDGADGNDVIQGNAGDDSIMGGLGLDTIHGGLGADFVRGDAGNDSLCGGPDDSENLDPALDGSDTIFGGSGNDAINGDAGDDFLNGGDGNDQLWGGDGQDTIGVFVYNGVTQFDAGNDSMIGGLGDDVIAGALVDAAGKLVNDGNDVMFGQEGNDTMWGGAGGDMIYGGEGNDVMLGGTPLTANTLHAPRNGKLPNDGNDTMFGGNGFDKVDGGNNNNLLDAGNDGIRETVLGGKGNDMGYRHILQDPVNYDILALDGGFNHKFCDGGLEEPPVQAASCTYIDWAIPSNYFTGVKTLKNGDIVEHPSLDYRTKPNNGPNGPVKGAQVKSTMIKTAVSQSVIAISAVSYAGKANTVGKLAGASLNSKTFRI